MANVTRDESDLGPTTWRCPRCDGQLVAVEYEYAIIETCPECGGEWCDRHELLQITKTLEEKFTADEVAQVRGIDDLQITARDELAHDLVCPKCADTRLVSFNYSGTSGLILDKCPRCNGIWLDRDELEHAQILVEEWEKRLDDDRAAHGGTLKKLRTELAADLGDAYAAGPVGRFLGYNALMRLYERMAL